MTDPGERNLTRVACERCSHCRSKKDEPVFRDGGFVECKPPVEPSLWLRAFYNFAANGEVKEPFIVSAIEGRARDAWPFQFRPENLAQCGGFSAMGVEAEGTRPA